MGYLDLRGTLGQISSGRSRLPESALSEAGYGRAMNQLLNIAEFRRNSPRVFFDRTELLPILGIYSRQVSRGLWRDYTIDHRSNMAVFSIFRRAREQPLFAITKVLLRGDRNPKFVLTSRNGQIGSSRSLAEIVDLLSRQLAVV